MHALGHVRPELVTAFVTLVTALLFETAALRAKAQTRAVDPVATNSAELWQEPSDLEGRDLFAGPTAGMSAPDPKVPFVFVAVDRTGYSRGYDVKDASGVEWSIKLGKEAQTEVVASRILWAIGYHQIPTYYLTQWTMTGGPGGNPGPGRFRPEPPAYKVVGDWSWSENPFAGTQRLKGLVVANLILNNWDWKTSNNKVYEVAGGDGAPSRMYVVRDLGASLGKTSSPKILRSLGLPGGQGSRNDIDGFERQGFIRSVAGDRAEFDYKGIYKGILNTVGVRDVVWTAQLMSRLSDQQWNDAFRAGGFPPDQAARYIAKLKSKVAEGLALATRSEGRSPAAETGSAP